MKVESIPDTKHGEVSASYQITGQTAQAAQGSANEEEQSSRIDNMVASEQRKFHVTHVWDRLCSSDFSLSDDYVFGSYDIAWQTLTHVLHVSRVQTNYYASGSDRPSLHEQASIITELLETLDAAGLLSVGYIPPITFSGPKIFVPCQNQHMLLQSFELLKQKNTLTSTFRLSFLFKGFPFQPRFWRFEGFDVDIDAEEFRRDLNTYLANNASLLGRARAVWVLSYHLAGFEGRKFPAGKMLVLCEATCMANSNSLRPFNGALPRLQRDPELE